MESGIGMAVRNSTIAIFFILCLILMDPFPGQAAGMSIGAVTWCGAWEPAWMDGKRKLPMGMPTGSGNSSYPVPIPQTTNPFVVTPSALYGPSFSLKITERIGISSVFLYGRFGAASSGVALSFWGPMVSRYSKSIAKFDSDSTLSINVMRNVRLIAGFKFQGYDYNETHRYMTSMGPGSSGGLYAPRAKDRMRSLGPAAGIALSFRLVDQLYLQCNLTASFLFGTEAYRFHHYAYLLTSTSDPVRFNRYFESSFMTLGANGTLAFAYLIDRANITLSLGFRYQALYYFYHPKGWKKYYESPRYDGCYDHFYGLIAAVTYSISFTRKPQ